MNMTVVNTRQGRTLFMHGTGRRPTVSFAMDSRGRQIDLRQRLAFDEVADMTDSMFANRVISALRAKLGPDEMDRILKVMVDADLITSEEASAVGDDVDVETNGPREAMASDAMFPHQNRLGPPLAVASRRTPPARMTADQSRQHDEMFPHANRLKA